MKPAQNTPKKEIKTGKATQDVFRVQFIGQSGNSNQVIFIPESTTLRQLWPNAKKTSTFNVCLAIITKEEIPKDTHRVWFGNMAWISSDYLKKRRKKKHTGASKH